MSTTTPNYSLILPTVGADRNIWGGLLNSNTSFLDTFLRSFENTFIGSSQPTTTQAGTMWINNTTNPWVLSVYSGTTWITIGNIDTVGNTFTVPTASYFVGDYKLSAQSANHGSWLLCDGSSVSTTTYATLFALPNMGYAFGGSGANFNLPDLRGLVPGGIGLNGNASFVPPLTNRTIGTYIGEETHTLTIPEIPSHTHTLNGVNAPLPGPNRVVDIVDCNINNFFSGAIGSTGGSGSHNNMQPTLFVGNYFIFSGV